MTTSSGLDATSPGHRAAGHGAAGCAYLGRAAAVDHPRGDRLSDNTHALGRVRGSSRNPDSPIGPGGHSVGAHW